MTEPALDTLDEWPWPRWEFVTALHDDDGITVALAPLPDSEPIEVVYDSGVITVAFAPDDVEALLAGIEFERHFDMLTEAFGPAPVDLAAHGYDITGRLTDSTGAENTFDG